MEKGRDERSNGRGNAATAGKERPSHRFEGMLQGMGDGLVALDREWRYTFANDKALEILGKRREELLGNTIWEVFPGAIGTPFEDQYRKVMDRRIPVSFESFFPSLNIWFEIYAYPLEDGIAVQFANINDRKKAEEALHRSEERIRLGQQIAHVGTFEWNIKTGVNAWTPELEALYGLPPGGFPGTEPAWENLIHPDDRSSMIHAVNSAIKTNNPTEKEWRVIWPDGSLHWIAGRFQAISDANGTPQRLLGANIDITERKKADEALRASYAQLEERVRERTAALERSLSISEKRQQEAEEARSILEAIMEYIPEGLLIADAGTKTVRMVSKYIAEYGGMSREQMRGISLSEYGKYLKIADTAAVPVNLEKLPIWRSLAYGHLVLDEEYILTRKNGESVNVLINTVPVRDKQGKIIGAVASWRDITERKKAEETLRRNEYELRTLVDNSPDLIFRLDRHQRYVYANPAYEKLTGLSKEQFAGKTNVQLGMLRNLAAFWQSTVQNVIESGSERSVEFEMDSFFGKRYFLARLIPEFEKSGLDETVLVIARDITERKYAEEQIRYISFHDEVTGLFNRAFFEEEIHRVDTERELPVSIIMGDVNNLKLSNDVFGHEEGDNLLKTIADIFRKACRKNDIIARWGGDEFAVILPKTDLAVAQEVCGRVKQIARDTLKTVVRPSIALGIATKEKRDQNIYRTIRQAEQRMYQNKLDESQENEQCVYDSLFERMRGRTGDMHAHLERSHNLADRFGAALSLSESQMDDLHLLVKLHDIGDAVIPREILTKTGRLTEREWEIMKNHVEAGFRIVKTFADTARISDEVLAHNERWDGLGYPRGMKGTAIPCLARVFAVIDAYDVMTHPRPYARAFMPQEAVEELRRNAGKQFDPELVDVFINKVLKEEEAFV